jgi:hypothetical protein
MEAIKSRRTNILVLLLSFGFLLLGSCAFGQVERINENGVIRRFTSNSLCFQIPLITKDTIFLNLMSDSVDAKTITFNVYVYFPDKIKVGEESIVIGHTDGTQTILQRYAFNEETNCASYEIVGDINKLVKGKPSFVLFRGIAKYDKFDKNYFSDFFKYL